MMSSGPAPREPLPTTFNPSQQNWPAYTREQYDTRQMDQAPMMGQNNLGGENPPKYNPSLQQQAPQNYGRNW